MKAYDVPMHRNILALLLILSAASPVHAQSEIPKDFSPATEFFDHVRREAKIPMRDGVKLHTVIMIPKGTAPAPIILTRTPYSATSRPRSATARTRR